MDRNSVEATFAGVTLRYQQNDFNGINGPEAYRTWAHMGRVGNLFMVMWTSDGTWAVSVLDPEGQVMERVFGLASPDSTAETMFSRYASVV